MVSFRPLVSIVKGGKSPSEKEIDWMVRRALRLLKLPDGFIPRNSTVLVKPNVTWGKPWTTGSTVNPSVVGSIVNWSFENGAGEVIIGEGAFIGVDTEEAFRATGFNRLAKEVGAKLVDLNKDKVVEVKIPQGRVLKKIWVAKTVLDANFIINVPMLKTHVLTKVTLSLKNMKGCLPYRGKRITHIMGLDQAIADLNTVLRQDLVVMDGILGQEGLGPISGDPVEMDLILASRHPLELDAVASAIMGFNPYDVKHLRFASENGLGTIDLDKIEIVGETLEKVARPFKPPPESLTKAYTGVNLVDGKACSGCYGSLEVALSRLKKSGELDQAVKELGGLTVLIGPYAVIPKEVGGELFICGKCLAKFSGSGHFIPGCPPQGWLIRDIVRKALGLPPIYKIEEILRIADKEYKN